MKAAVKWLKSLFCVSCVQDVINSELRLCHYKTWRLPVRVTFLSLVPEAISSFQIRFVNYGVFSSRKWKKWSSEQHVEWKSYPWWYVEKRCFRLLATERYLLITPSSSRWRTSSQRTVAVCICNCSQYVAKLSNSVQVELLQNILSYRKKRLGSGLLTYWFLFFLETRRF